MRRTDTPVYELILDPLEDGGKEASGFDKIAYVSDPAIDEVGVFLSAQDLIVQQRHFKLSNTEKQQVVAPLLIPNKLIDRNDKGYYQIKFSAEVIQQLKDKADSEGKLSSLNIMKDTHKGGIAPSFILEDWIIEDEDDKAYTEYGFDSKRVPIGTWMVITQVIDKDYWENEIKKNKKFAYSIEAFLNMKLTNLKLNKINMAKEKVDLVGENESTDNKNKNKTEMENENKVTFELDGKTYELIDGKPVLVVEEEVEAESAPVENEEVEAQEEEEVKDEEVNAEEDKKEVDVVAEEVETEEEKEVEAQEEEATEESSEEDEDKFEAIYDEIAKLRELISKMREEKPEEGKIEMSEQKNTLGGSIVALRKAIKSNK